MRYGMVTSWDPAIATGYIQEDGMSEKKMFRFVSSGEFYAGERVSFEEDVNGEACNIQPL